MSELVYVSLGSNIDPEHHLIHAVQLLHERGGTLHALSGVYQTAPQGYTQQADFLNMAVCLSTEYDIATFKTDVLGSIEQTLKRVRDPHNKNAPRTIDLDIALWGATIQEYGAKPWRVPEADIIRFAHVALPLADIAPHLPHPENGKTLQAIAAGFATDQITVRRDVVFTVPLVPRNPQAE